MTSWASNSMSNDLGQVSRSSFRDIEDRMYEKYELSRTDARLAVDYLFCFLDRKKTRPEEDIVLPQIADWAWHELILDTARYRALCLGLFGQFLHHAMKPIGARKEAPNELQGTFVRSLSIMRKVYGLGLGDRLSDWLDAGWARPQYRLRCPLRVSDVARNGEIAFLQIGTTPEHLSWLPSRIARRFDVPLAVAEHGVRAYARAIPSLRPDSPLTSSPLLRIAWEEHILWTKRYAEDCDRSLGRFLDHVPRDPGASYLTSISATAA